VVQVAVDESDEQRTALARAALQKVVQGRLLAGLPGLLKAFLDADESVPAGHRQLGKQASTGGEVGGHDRITSALEER
jgi:hypothetical protein